MPLVPSRVLVWSSAVPLVLTALALLDERFRGLAMWVNAALVVLASLDALFARRALVAVERFAPDVMSLKRRNEVRLFVRSSSRRKFVVRVRDDLFEGAAAADLPLRITLEPRSGRNASYHVEPSQRGAFELGDHNVRYPSPLGFWDRQLRLRARTAVKVYPDLRQIQMFDQLARESRELEWVRSSKRKGGETEFSRLREYVAGDEYRAVDWKATARRQQLTVREYQLESNQNIVFMLDGGRMMTGIESGLSRFDHALNATLMLGHVAARGGDRVGVLGFDEAVRAFVAPASGPRAVRRLIQATYDLYPRFVDADYDAAFGYLSQRLRARALVVIFSHVFDASVAQTLLRRVRAVRTRHLPLVVMFRDRDVEKLLEPGSAEGADHFTKAAAAEVLRFQKSVMRSMVRAGALLLETDAASLTGKLVSRYLEIKARNQL
ncbi:MAG TPA: DUF58 domain-containing protein [Polyangiaceae bacterium]|nr:DUF58 domain-containing protein [Polyangiaceae bacterium]